jgi:primase-polymerase (primpol)-like protein
LLLLKIYTSLSAVVKGQLSERQAVIAAPQKTTSYPSIQSANEVIERIRKSRMAREFNDLYAGQDLNGDRSRSDLRLCGIAAFFSGGDAGITKEIFMSSGLYRGGEKSAGYVDRTVNLAVKNLRTQIKPPKAFDNGK